MRKQVATLHFLTQDLAHYTHEAQARVACEAGIRWVQLRTKNKSFKEWLQIAQQVKQVTDAFSATLIINDSVKACAETNADGVHLGQEDEQWDMARKILGDEKIIGYSTHTYKEIAKAKDFDVDYFGLGPFRFTTTKEKLNSILGLDGVQMIIEKATLHNIRKPVIVIGGINENDVTAIMNAGAGGIAVSSAINLSENPLLTAQNILGRIKNTNLKSQTSI